MSSKYDDNKNYHYYRAIKNDNLNENRLAIKRFVVAL